MPRNEERKQTLRLILVPLTLPDILPSKRESATPAQSQLGWKEQ